MSGGVTLYGPSGVGGGLDWGRTLAALAVEVEEIRSDELRGILAKVVATSPITRAGLPVIDGYQTVGTDVVLLTAQASLADNGPWLVGPSGWSRPTAFADGSQVTGGTVVVTGGVLGAGTTWTLNTTGTVTVGTTAQTWVQPLVDTTTTQTVRATKSFPSIRVKGPRVDPTHPDFGAVGDGVHEDFDAVQAALNFAASTGVLGNGIEPPPGTYRMTSGGVPRELVIPSTAPQSFLNIGGVHHGNTRFYWPLDAGTGKAGIRQADASTYPYKHYIHDLALVGPGAGALPVDGTPPALMDGIQMRQKWIVERVNASYFNSGILPFDHTVIRDCDLNGNYYGLCWAYANIGDIEVTHCDLGSNRWASIGVKPGMNIVSTTFKGTHLCVASPYGLYLEPGAGSHLLADNQWINVSWEGIILGAIYDEDNDSTIQDQLFLGGGMAWGGYATTAGRTRSELIKAQVWVRNKQMGNVTFFLTDAAVTGAGARPAVPAVRCTTFKGSSMESFEQDQANASANGTPLIVGPAAGSCEGTWSHGGGSIRGRFSPSGSAVVAGQVLAQRNIGTVRAYNLGNANEPVAGIAMATMAAGVVPYATQGDVVRCQYTGNPAIGDYAVISSTSSDKIESYPVTTAAKAGLPRPVLGTIYGVPTTDADGISRVPVTLAISA